MTITSKHPYHYKACGLDNVYLINGFTLYDNEEDGQAISFEDIEGLHTAIGLHIIKFNRKLDGKEIRYLRNEMEITQAALAKLLGVDEQTVRNWEQNQSTNVPADRLVRLLYVEYISKNPHVHELLERLSQLETDHEGTCRFVRTAEEGWKAAA